MIVHAFAPRVKDYVGHPFHYHQGAQEAIEDIGGTYQVYLSKTHQLQPLQPHWTPWFPPLTSSLQLHLAAAQFVRRAKGEKRIFFIETFVRRDFRAFCNALLCFGKATDAPWILFRDDHIWKRPRDRASLRFWIPKLQKKFPFLRFLSDSALIAHFLSDQLSVSFHVLPLPHTPPYAAMQAPTTRKLLFLGEPRLEKGTSWIQQLCGLSGVAHFTLMCSEAVSIPSPPTLTIERHRASLCPESYWDTLRSADALLLPYSPERYQRRTSGIFVEAIFLGKIPLVMKDTWMAEELRQFDLQELIVNWDSPSFFSELEQIWNSPSVHAKLAAMQQAYLSFHSRHAFQDCFQSLIPTEWRT